MKYLILCLFTSCSFLPLFGQVYVNDVNVNTLNDVKYIEVQPVTNITTGSKSKCLVNYGQSIRLKNYGNNYLRESKNKSRDHKFFNSRVAILNWFDNQGWDLVQVIPETTGGESSNRDIIYILKKKE